MVPEAEKQIEQEKMGEDCYLNNNCFLVNNLKYPPYNRCQYCELKFRQCLFLQYQIITLILIVSSFSLIFLFDRKVSFAVIIVLFIIIVTYGYFFNISTEKIVKTSFLEKKAKNELKELSGKLEEKVADQTKDIRKQNRYLEELLNMKNDFLRTVNHQLNTPLSIMKNAFAMMEDKSLSTEQGMKIAAHGLERMSSTIQDLWDAFELEEKGMSAELSEVDLLTVIKDMVKEKKKIELVQQRKLKVILVKPKFVVPKVLCDQKKIGHVVSNLLDNAIFYTYKGSIKIWFEKIVKGKKEYLKVFVQDTGEGIPLEDQKNIYVKFFRASTASAINPNGSGLGLYIAKSIIESSKGRLKLEQSEVGKGSTFSFCLEVARAKKTRQK